MRTAPFFVLLGLFAVVEYRPPPSPLATAPPDRAPERFALARSDLCVPLSLSFSGAWVFFYFSASFLCLLDGFPVFFIQPSGSVFPFLPSF